MGARRPGESEDQWINSYKMGIPVFFEEVQNPDYPSDPKAQYEVFNVTEGKVFRFRLISGIGEETNMRISIEGHNFKAIASDAIDIEETQPLDAVWLAAGERYDIHVQTKSKEETNEHRSAYKIRIYHSYKHNKENKKNTTFELCSIAWLRYHGQTVNSTFEPDCKSMGQETFEYAILNPVPNNAAEWNSSKNIYPKDLKAKSQAKNIERVLNTHYVNMSCGPDGYGIWRCNFNNYQMLFPTAQTAGSVNASGYPDVPFLFQSPSNQAGRCGAVCDRTKCTNQGPMELANCSHVLQQPEAVGEWFEIVLINTNTDGGVAHPIHQHGGWYNIIGQDQFDQNIKISRELIIEKDKECGRSRCLPRNFDRPVFKDVIQVPTNGYVIFRTPLDNPGAWIVHCHINYHIEHGMAMVFQFGEPHGWAMGPNETQALDNKNTMCFH